LRVDIKELRYIIEDLGYFNKDKNNHLKLLKNLQDILGKINDTYVAQNIINHLGKTLEIGITRSYIEDQAENSRNKYLLELKNIK
jgi:CHAD domain-containing protein